MVKDRYTFVQSRKSAATISMGYRDSLEGHGSPLQFVLAMNLQKFMTKLFAHSRGFGEKSTRKISMSKHEALSFHVAYEFGYIDTSCPFVREIFTEIDRSFNNKPVKPNDSNTLSKRG